LDRVNGLGRMAPLSQFENMNTVGSTAWLDLRAKRDPQRQLLNNIPSASKDALRAPRLTASALLLNGAGSTNWQ
jgi:hypothetical protein